METPEVIKVMGIGHILPCETHQPQEQAKEGDDSISTQVEPSSSQVDPSNAPQEETISLEKTPSQEQDLSPPSVEQDQEKNKNLLPLMIKLKTVLPTLNTQKKNLLVMMVWSGVSRLPRLQATCM